ncbi:MAG: DNA-binding transcriptional regulator [Gammaproteobacteria bacterium]|nr:DNA-binding transcriptional regulator [Gammaproteobacteria bacterium]
MKTQASKNWPHPFAKQLYKAIAKLKTADKIEYFLLDLCTPAELQAMADRLQVAAQLEEKHSYRQIHEATEVSVTTIGRVARTMAFGHGGYQAALKQLKERN